MKNVIFNLFLLTVLGLAYPLNSQNNQKCGTPDAPDPLDGVSTMQASSYAGPYYIKVYATIFRKTSGDDGATEQEFKDEFKVAKEALEAHNIHLHLACIKEEHDSYYYLNQGITLANYPANSDGLDLYIFDHDDGNESGKASSLASMKCWANVVLSPTTLIHEIGHCFGLYHTHRNNSCNCTGSDCELVDGSNCSTTGDLVCDTKADPGGTWHLQCQYYDPGNCTDKNDDNFNPNVDNIMSYYTGCREVFTDGQGERMRMILENDGDVSGMQRNDYYISDNTTLQKTGYVDVDLIVEEGTRFSEITQCDLEFAPGKGIIIEEDVFNFLIEDSDLTRGDPDGVCSTSDDFWTGVGLESADDTYAPAFIYMDGTTIVDAKGGIYFINSSTDKRKPRIYGDGNTFINNRIAIIMEEGRQFSGGYPGTYSVMRNSTFEVNSEYIGNNFPCHIFQYHHEAGLDVRGSTFKHNWSSAPINRFTHNSGIISFGSKLFVRDVVDGKNKFSDFKAGVNILSDFTSFRQAKIEGNDFEDNQWSILTHAEDYGEILDNYIVMKDDQSAPVGINFMGSSGFRCVDNEMISPSNNRNKSGIWAIDIGDAPNEIENNEVENAAIGYFSQGDNGNQSMPMTGLKYWCNESTTNSFSDFYWTGNVSVFQGNPINASTNGFSNTSSTNGSDVTNQGFEVKYYYLSGNANQNPQHSIGITALDVNNPKCNSPGAGFSGGIGPSVTIVDLDEVYTDERNYLDSLIVDYNNTKDSLDSVEVVIKEINIDIANTDMHSTLNNALYLLTQEWIDTLPTDYPEIRTWLERKESMRGYINAAKTYLEEEDTSGFNSYLNNIPAEQDFTEDEDANYEDYKSAVTMILNAADQGRSQRELDSLEVDTLLDIANNNDSYVGQYARNILTHFYDYSFSMPDPYPSSIISSTNEQENINKGYSISPNPSNSIVELAIQSFNIEDEYRYRVYSLNGTLLKERGFNTNHVSFSVSDYPEGIYIINVTANNRNLGTTKLIIQ